MPFSFLPHPLFSSSEMARPLLYMKVRSPFSPHQLEFADRRRSMTQTLETDRRQHLRDGILDLLGDITYRILRQYGMDNAVPTTAAEVIAAATATT